jgi:hypothetical protein
MAPSEVIETSISGSEKERTNNNCKNNESKTDEYRPDDLRPH